LRATSAADAARAAEIARALGAEFRILHWTGAKPARGVQAGARDARHRLLADACAELGAAALLLGHTLDDQAETVLMRLMRAPATTRGLAGLDAVAPSPAWPQGAGLALARPLLSARCEDLRRRLRAAGLAWIEDPANLDLAHERVRARMALAGLGEESVQRLAALADRAARAEAVRRDLALRALRAVSLRPWGGLALDRARFALAPRAGRALALEAVLSAAAGTPGPLAPAAIDRLLDALEPGAPCAGATVGGAAIARDAQGVVAIARDPGGAAGRGHRPARLTYEQDVWDGRFRILEPLSGDEKLQAAQGVMASLDGPDRERLRAAPALARRSAPVVMAPGRPSRLPEAVFIGSQAIARRVLPDRPAAWCDDAAARVALGFGAVAPHMRSRLETTDRSNEDADRTGMTQA
jgi:tRNA(Ile)-lysidine synthase